MEEVDCHVSLNFFLVMSYFPRIAHDKINIMYNCAFLTYPKPKDVQNIVFDKWIHQSTI
jgi:hypothetical protein